MKQIKAVIFDLDGTLLDTAQDLSDAVNYALKSFAYPSLSVEQVKARTGNGVGRLVELALSGGLSNPDYKRVLSTFKEYYLRHSSDNTSPYAGIDQLLTELCDKGIKTAIVSNKLNDATKQLNVKYFGRFHMIAQGETPFVRRKPNPDTLFAVLSQLDCRRDECIYVGDSEVDVQTGANAEIEVVSVSWGFRSKEQLLACGAKHIVDAPSQILEIVGKNENIR